MASTAAQDGVVRTGDAHESEPLLGRPGDVAQRQGASLARNLPMGTGIVALLGALLLLALVWAGIFTHRLIVFSGHPLAQSLAIVTLVVSVLLLQPTHTAEQKRAGQRAHASLNLAALLLLAAGVTIVEYNKAASRGAHLHSAHGWLGAAACVVVVGQALVGVTMWAAPRLYGGEARARAVWKYHRYSGYLLLLLLLATACSATDTDYNINVLHIRMWAMVLASVLVVLGVFPRIQKQKLGLGSPPPAAAAPASTAAA